MISKDDLKKIVLLQQEELKLYELGVEREKSNEINLNLGLAIILSGIRRCGKSTLMRQLMHKIKGTCYLNFEDPRLMNLEISDCLKLEEIFKELGQQQKFYFFDEIQNIPKWELFVRRLVDNKKNVIITGSNASLLSKELGTRLTGRHINYELFPFSYQEFLNFTKGRAGLDSFERYLFEGGFPEYLRTHSPPLLQELLKDIITRDIASRHGIRNIAVLNGLAVYLLTNVGKEFSYLSLKKIFKLGSVNSIISFISYFEDSYLLFTVSRFDYSLKKSLIYPKKIYSVDNGFTNKNTLSFSQDKGRMLENLVFIALKQFKKEIYYFKDKQECDFLLKQEHKIMAAVQVCYHLNEDNKEREIGGLQEAMVKFKLKEGLILTHDQDDNFTISNRRIIVKPIWKWLLEK